MPGARAAAAKSPRERGCLPDSHRRYGVDGAQKPITGRGLGHASSAGVLTGRLCGGGCCCRCRHGRAGQRGRGSARVLAASDTWPMFGHDPLHSGVSPDTAIGASTAPGLTTKWSKRLSSVHDQPSPAVAFNATRSETLVYEVTHGGVVSAFNASTGALVWRRTVGPNVDSSPAVYRNTVYFGDNRGTLEALNAATGAVQCTFTLPVSPPATTPGPHHRLARGRQRRRDGPDRVLRRRGRRLGDRSAERRSHVGRHRRRQHRRGVQGKMGRTTTGRTRARTAR